MRRLKLFLLSLGLALFLVPAGSALAQVNIFDKVCNENPNKATIVENETCKSQGANPITGSNSTLAKVTRLIANIAGSAAMIVMIVGGIMYVLSNGDPQKVSAAKNTVLYALIGLVVIVFARAVIIFILNRVN